MQLIEDWKKVLLQAWSVKLATIAAVLSALDALQFILPFLDGVVPPRVLSGLALLAAIGAVGARLIQQPAMHEGDR